MSHYVSIYSGFTSARELKGGGFYTQNAEAGIAKSRVLNFELYTHRRQKLTLLHLFTGLFRKEIFLTLQNKCKVSLD